MQPITPAAGVVSVSWRIEISRRWERSPPVREPSSVRIEFDQAQVWGVLWMRDDDRGDTSGAVFEREVGSFAVSPEARSPRGMLRVPIRPSDERTSVVNENARDVDEPAWRREVRRAPVRPVKRRPAADADDVKIPSVDEQVT